GELCVRRPADAIAGAELDEARLPEFQRADREHTEEAVREVEARAVPLIEARHFLVVEPAPGRVTKLEDRAEASDHVLVAAVDAERPALRRRRARFDLLELADVDPRTGRTVVAHVSAGRSSSEAIEVPLHAGRDVERAELAPPIGNVELRTVRCRRDRLAASRCADDELPRRRERWKLCGRCARPRALRAEVVAH